MASVIDKHPQRQKIIDLILEGKPLRDIAAVVSPKVSIMAIQRYRKNFVAPVMRNVDTLASVTQNVTREALLAAPILAIRERRLAELQKRHDLFEQVRKERAADMADAPGGKTGLLTRKYKQLGSGPLAQTVEEYAVDTALLAEWREHEKQAAIELGQWQDSDSRAPGTVNNWYVAMVAPAGPPIHPPTVIDVAPAGSVLPDNGTDVCK